MILRAWIIAVGCLGLSVLLASAQVPAQDPPLGAPVLAYTSAQHEQIYLYDLATTNTRTLNLGVGVHHVWGFSPEGCRLLVSLGAGRLGGRLYSVKLDGSDLREVVRYDELPAQAWGVWEAVWSPNAQDPRIAFVMLREQANRGGVEIAHHIAHVQADAQGDWSATPQFYSVTGREYNPQWSPDGSLLAYISYDERVAGADPLSTAMPTPDSAPASPLTTVMEADLWLVSADGQTKTRLTNFSVGSVTLPRWSPQGDLLGFVYSPSSNNDLFWMIAPQQGAIPTQLSLGGVNILDMTWSPDGAHLVGAARNLQQFNENALWSLPLIGYADTDAVRLNEALISVDFPRYSADGAWLAARSAYALAIVNQATGETRLLEGEALGNTPPLWSPLSYQGEAQCR